MRTFAILNNKTRQKEVKSMPNSSRALREDWLSIDRLQNKTAKHLSLTNRSITSNITDTNIHSSSNYQFCHTYFWLNLRWALPTTEQGSTTSAYNFVSSSHRARMILSLSSFVWNSIEQSNDMKLLIPKDMLLFIYLVCFMCTCWVLIPRRHHPPMGEGSDIYLSKLELLGTWYGSIMYSTDNNFQF